MSSYRQQPFSCSSSQRYPSPARRPWKTLVSPLAPLGLIEVGVESSSRSSSRINARKRKQATSRSRGAVLSWRHGAYEQQVELGAEYGVHGVPLQVFLQKCWMVGASLEDVYIDIWGGGHS